MEPNFFERVYRVVERIPRGRVASYGQIAALLGYPRAARTVGWALASLPEARAASVPWQRVINRAGRISISRADLSPSYQRQLLEAEGVVFDDYDRVDMNRYGWRGLDPVEIQAMWSEWET
jgi:methylated-DNA-protein-cysteine methyltransferase-like protein